MASSTPNLACQLGVFVSLKPAVRTYNMDSWRYGVYVCFPLSAKAKRCDAIVRGSLGGRALSLFPDVGVSFLLESGEAHGKQGT